MKATGTKIRGVGWQALPHIDDSYIKNPRLAWRVNRGLFKV